MLSECPHTRPRGRARSQVRRLQQVAVGVMLMFARTVAADDAGAVPPAVQADLTAKVASFDRNLRARASGRVVVLIVEKQDDAASARMAEFFADALGRLDRIASLPHKEVRVRYASAAAVASTVRDLGVSIVFLSLGLNAEAVSIAQALEGSNVLSVSAEPSAATKAVVLAFALVESRPKLLINLERAKRQNVDLPASVLRLARIYR